MTNKNTEQPDGTGHGASDLDELVMCEYSQGVFSDYAAILRDGQPMTIEEILASLMQAQKLARIIVFALEGLNNFVEFNKPGIMEE